MEGTVCVVTGANSGIGKETARELSRRGATVVMTARNQERGEAAATEVRTSTGSDRVELLMLDLADLDSVRAAAAELKQRHDRLDVLINNAGLVLTRRTTTPQGHESTFGINHLGPFLFTRLLEEPLAAAAPARVVNLSSMGHRLSGGLNFDDLQWEQRSFSGVSVYNDSKLCNVLFTKELARRWADRGITAYAVHPGIVRSGFGGDGDAPGWFGTMIAMTKVFYLSPQRGSRTSVKCATADLESLVSGGYYAHSRRMRASGKGKNAETAARLWDVSEQLVGLAS
ncbi:MAG: SDR family NAD(P)-dependent oxidoreductase [Proteobacteria bacterium]|nr:SDR family NAD(P)-dependent oxidoreductase [Pseudomonadota bacterium]